MSISISEQSHRFGSALLLRICGRGEKQSSGLAASAMHGAKWIDDDSPVELIWNNARSPNGVVTRDQLLLETEIQRLDGLSVTTPQRTAFDLGRRGRLGDTVARLDALAAATGFKASDVADLARWHRRARGLRQLEKALELMDAGAESPKETWLRLLIIRAGFPRPRTQIPVLSPDGRRWYFLDMGWEDIKLAAEYDGDHHRSDPVVFAYDIRRLDDLRERGWTIIRVAARHRSDDVIPRLRRAWDALTLR
jgi:very-short-patch-repair endonuclease